MFCTDVWAAVTAKVASGAAFRDARGSSEGKTSTLDGSGHKVVADSYDPNASRFASGSYFNIEPHNSNEGKQMQTNANIIGEADCYNSPALLEALISGLENAWRHPSLVPPTSVSGTIAPI